MIIKRGSLDMLQLDGDAARDAPRGQLHPGRPGALGRWRLAGEICDGKCYAGAMRPGRGLAHKACANLCLTRRCAAGVRQRGAGRGISFLLLAAPDGGPYRTMAATWWRWAIELEGQIDRLDDLLVFRADLATAGRL